MERREHVMSFVSVSKEAEIAPTTLNWGKVVHCLHGAFRLSVDQTPKIVSVSQRIARSSSP
jgi:hypothetical protein